jgi:hypothetical protein
MSCALAHTTKTIESRRVKTSAALVLALGAVVLLAPTAHAAPLDGPIASVCRSGSFWNGGNHPTLRNAVGQAGCVSFKGNPILIGEYRSGDDAKIDAAQWLNGHGSDAAGKLDGELWVFFAPVDNSGQSLQPLTQYGFSVETPNK